MKLVAKRLTQEQAEERVKARCDELGYEFVPFVYVNWKTKVPIKCGVEGHGTYYLTYNNFISSGYGCGLCGQIKNSESIKLTKDVYLTRVHERANELNYTFEPFEYTTAEQTYIKMKCDNPEHPVYDVSYHKFVNGKRKCAKCVGNKKYTQEEMDAYIHAYCEERNYYYSSFVYMNQRTKITLKCSNPEHREFSPSAAAIRKTYAGCPSCCTGGYNPSREAWLYINEISVGENVYYKFGITNKYNTRMRDYRSNILESEPYRLFYSVDGVLIQSIESEIKKDKSITRNAIKRELFNDGFSETIHSHDLQKVLDIISKYPLIEESINQNKEE